MKSRFQFNFVSPTLGCSGASLITLGSSDKEMNGFDALGRIHLVGLCDNYSIGVTSLNLENFTLYLLLRVSVKLNKVLIK